METGCNSENPVSKWMDQPKLDLMGHQTDMHREVESIPFAPKLGPADFYMSLQGPGMLTGLSANFLHIFPKSKKFSGISCQRWVDCFQLGCKLGV